jgi:hypothetical protein
MGERYVSNIRDVRSFRGVDCGTELLFWYTLNIEREHLIISEGEGEEEI